MNVQEKKIELAKRILNTDNPALLQKVDDALGNASNHALTEQERYEIELGLRMLNEGKRVSWEDFKKKHFK